MRARGETESESAEGKGGQNPSVLFRGMKRLGSEKADRRTDADEGRGHLPAETFCSWINAASGELGIGMSGASGAGHCSVKETLTEVRCVLPDNESLTCAVDGEDG